MRLFVARHGETEWNRIGRLQGHTDTPLNEKGRAQAHALAKRLARAGIARVRSSDLCRARETAEIVAAALRVPIEPPDAELRERLFGEWEGLTREECAERYPEAWTRYRVEPRGCPPGGEPHDAFISRARAALLRAAREGEGTALVVAHGGIMRGLIAETMGEAPPPIHNTAVFEVRFYGDRIVAFDALPPVNTSERARGT